MSQQEEEKVFFCHLRTHFPGAITVSYQEAEDNSLSVGFSFCSMNDNFSRARGREISAGRRQKDPIKIEKPVRNEKGKIEITKTMTAFLHGLIADKTDDLESILHVRKWANSAEEPVYRGDFLPWFVFFVKALHKQVSKEEKCESSS